MNSLQVSQNASASIVSPSHSQDWQRNVSRPPWLDVECLSSYSLRPDTSNLNYENQSLCNNEGNIILTNV
jgi:hypothetical protein